MKKAIAMFAVTALLLATVPTTVFAYGHGDTKRSASAYTLCTATNCNTVGNHTHNGMTYTGHYIGDGHDYHQLCSVQNCTKTGSHSHNGTVCLPHDNNDGHSYHGAGHRSGGCH